jgi:Family of unknown function (DUF6132)
MKKLLIPFVGILLGAIGGYFYWQQVGCASGTCMITSKPLNTTLYGGFMGYLIAGIAEDLFSKKS